MHLEKKGLITGIRFKEILDRYNVNPKKFSTSHKKLDEKMQKATGCYGDHMNWPDFGDRTKFFVVMSKDENGEAAYYRILL